MDKVVEATEIAYEDLGAENMHNQKNCGEISLGKLRHIGKRNPIGVDISTTCHNKYRRRVCGSGGDGDIVHRNNTIKYPK